MTAYIVPGLVRAKLLADVSLGIFSGPALFVAATFVGLFIGAIVFGFAADKYGRRAIFTYSMLVYCAATLVMAFQDSGWGVCLWRMIAGVGIGVELVTIDTYVSELVPARMRGRAFAFNQTIQFLVVPLVAFLSYVLVPLTPLGWDGWRWVVAIGAIGALFVWFLRRAIPESPRWLIKHGRIAEAEAVTARIEAAVAADLGGAPLPPVDEHAVEDLRPPGAFREIWREPYRRRTIMMMVFQFFQTFGFYGFAAWVPTLIVQQTGIDLRASLLYSFIIAIANPFGPLIAMSFADRLERKWQLVGAAIGIAIFGILFSMQSAMAPLILFGVLITLAEQCAVLLLPRLSDRTVPDPGARPRGRIHLRLQPDQHRLRELHHRVLLRPFQRRDRRLRPHRLRDGDGRAVDRNLRAGDARPAVGAGLAVRFLT